ncbi:MAG TPA: SDR family oxidoreductase [Syntrophomonadaceae bacterium]|nr:SDR family oxidoreductase [Syntrophomonadaceae bacterium]
MKSVVITGSSRGLGFALAKSFLEHGCSVTISGKNLDNLVRAQEKLNFVSRTVQAVLCDVRSWPDVSRLWHEAQDHWGRVDIWINNAGINQPDLYLWELSTVDTNNLLQTNLSGLIYGSQVAMQGMMSQQGGQIYNVEGFGNNGMMRTGLNLYGTSKRAVSHFTRALAREAAGTGVQVGLLSPGMMVTDFITGPIGESQVRKISAHTKSIFNILGDHPDEVGRFLVSRILRNRKNGVQLVWLTRSKAIFRLVKSTLVKRDLFS